MRENVLQRNIIRKLNDTSGVFAFKVDSPGRRGVPDLCVLVDGGATAWIEVKTETGRLSPWQVRMHERMTGLGHRVYVVRSVQEVEQVLADLIIV